MEKQLAGLVEAIQYSNIKVTPLIANEDEVQEQSGWQVGQFCRRRKDTKIRKEEVCSEEGFFFAKESRVKKVQFIQNLSIMIVHSYKRVEFYQICQQNTIKLQTIEFETDPEVVRGFAYNSRNLLFAFGKKLIGYIWSEDSQKFISTQPLFLRESVIVVCSGVEESSENIVDSTGFIVSTTKNTVHLLRLQDSKLFVHSAIVIEDRGTSFQKQCNLMFYHKKHVLLLRLQTASLEIEKLNNQTNKSKGNLQLKTIVAVTFVDCDPFSGKGAFFVRQYSHKLDLKQFEVTQQIDGVYLLPQMQNGKNRLAIVSQDNRLLLVFGYKDGSYLLDKAAHYPKKLHFDFDNNIIVGVKEDDQCEICTFNDSGTYEAVIADENTLQAITLYQQTCIDVQENFILPFNSDSVIAIEKVQNEKGYSYQYLVQEKGFDDKVFQQKKLQPEDGQKQESLVFSLFKMRLVTPKEKLRHLIAKNFNNSQSYKCNPESDQKVENQGQEEIQATIKWFGFDKEIINMIKWEQSKKSPEDVDNFLVDNREEKSNRREIEGVRDYIYLKKELKWLISEKKIHVGCITRILQHMIEVLAKNQFTTSYSTYQQHQKLEALNNRLEKIGQLLFTYQKLIVLYEIEETIVGGIREYKRISKQMTLQDLFLEVLEKKSEASLLELAQVFQRELLQNYYSLFYNLHRLQKETTLVDLFTKIDFLLPKSQILFQQDPQQILEQNDGLLLKKSPYQILWHQGTTFASQTLFCEQYAINCATFAERQEVTQKIIPEMHKNKNKLENKCLLSTIRDAKHLDELKSNLRSQKTYLCLVKQFTCLFGQANFSLMIIESALKEKGFGDSAVLKKEFISLSLYCLLLYENNQIDVEYENFRMKTQYNQFSLILLLNPTNPSLIISQKAQFIFEQHANKQGKISRLILKFLNSEDCTPNIFHQVIKAVNQELSSGTRIILLSQLISLVNSKLLLEHHDYLEQYVTMLDTHKGDKVRMQILSNCARIISNFTIIKPLNFLSDILEEATSGVSPIKSRDLIQEIIVNYSCNKFVERMVALDKSLGILDLKKVDHFLMLLIFLQEKFNGLRSDVERWLLNSLLEFEKFQLFREVLDVISLSVEDVDRIILTSVRNAFKKYKLSECKEQVAEHFQLLRIAKNPTRRQEKAFFKLACYLRSEPIGLNFTLAQLRKNQKYVVLYQVLHWLESKPRELAQANVFAIHRWFSKYDKPEDELLATYDEQFLKFLKDYAVRLIDVERIVSVIDVLKKEKSPYVADVCFYLITELSENISEQEHKRFTQLGLLECQNIELLPKIVALIHQKQNFEQQKTIVTSDDVGKGNKGISLFIQGRKKSEDTIQTISHNISDQIKKSSRFFNILSSTITNVMGSSQLLKEALKETLSKGDQVKIQSTAILSDEMVELFGVNEKKGNKILGEMISELQRINLKKCEQVLEVFWKLILRDNSWQGFYLLALSTESFELPVLDSLVFRMLSGTCTTTNQIQVFNHSKLIQSMVKICIYRILGKIEHQFFSSEITKEELVKVYLPQVIKEGSAGEQNKKILRKYADAMVLNSHIHYFRNFVSKGKWEISGQMI